MVSLQLSLLTLAQRQAQSSAKVMHVLFVTAMVVISMHGGRVTKISMDLETILRWTLPNHSPLLRSF